MKKTVWTLVLAAALLCAGTAVAASETREATLHYRDIRITLDGEELVPVDANGNEVEPFIMDGTTYLPVRAVAEALGLEVGWDPVTGTVELTQPPVTAEHLGEGRTLPEGTREYIQEESEYLSRILFRAAEPLYDVKLYAMEFQTDGYVKQEPELHSFGDVAEGEAFVAGVIFWGDMTSYGLTFTDGSGTERTCTISLSGLDGSVVLNPYE